MVFRGFKCFLDYHWLLVFVGDKRSFIEYIAYNLIPISFYFVRQISQFTISTIKHLKLYALNSGIFS